MKLPALFVSHGAPTFALAPGQLGPRLKALGQALPRPRAVLVVSPHWMTRGLEVTASPAPETIHDFGGFARELYSLRYPAPGAPEVAAEIVEHLARHGLHAVANPRRGLDHGAWVPLMHLYPQADVPVLQLSQPPVPSPLVLLQLGEALSGLREQGVLVVGSGSLTHNLYDIGLGPAAGDYARAFADWVWARIAEGDLGALLDYRAHPSDEHLLPLFVALGAAGADWRAARRLEGGIDCHVLSMDSFAFGCADH